MKSSNIGGQAVMEGIMMRSGDQYSIGVRKPDGEIEVKVEPYRSWAKDSSIWKLPVFRGVASFFESLVVGIRCLMYSASFIEDEEEDAKKPGKEKTEEQKEKEEKWLMYGIFCDIFHSPVYHAAVFPGRLSSECDDVGRRDRCCRSMCTHDSVSRLSGADFQNERYSESIYVSRSGT